MLGLLSKRPIISPLLTNYLVRTNGTSSTSLLFLCDGRPQSAAFYSLILIVQMH